MFKVITHMQRTSIKCLALKRAATKDSHVHTQELLKRKHGPPPAAAGSRTARRTAPVTAIWPGSWPYYFELLEEPWYEDFDVGSLEIGLRTWVMDTRMRSWKRREIRFGILMFCEREFEAGIDGREWYRMRDYRLGY
jgi:hypothetical protein